VLVNIDHRRLLGNVPSQTRLDAMRSVVMALGQSLRDEDVMASSSDTELALLLPELDGEQAKVVVERILAIIGKVSVELSPGGRNISLNGAAGIAPFYGEGGATTDVLIMRARNALESMKELTFGRVVISPEGQVSRRSADKQAEVEGAKTAAVAEEQLEVSEREEMMAMANLVKGLYEDEQIQEEQVEETLAVQDQAAVSEWGERVPVEESVSENHNGKKHQSHKVKRNEDSHPGLDLSEQENQ
jgi:hypothetical protein